MRGRARLRRPHARGRDGGRGIPCDRHGDSRFGALDAGARRAALSRARACRKAETGNRLGNASLREAYSSRLRRNRLHHNGRHAA